MTAVTVFLKVDVSVLQTSTLRRYKRHFKLQTRPGLNKTQLVEVRKKFLINFDRVFTCPYCRGRVFPIGILLPGYRSRTR